MANANNSELDIFCATLSAATGGKLAPHDVLSMLEGLFLAGQADAEVQMGLVFKKGPKKFVLALKGKEIVTNTTQARRMITHLVH